MMALSFTKISEATQQQHRILTEVLKDKRDLIPPLTQISTGLLGNIFAKIQTLYDTKRHAKQTLDCPSRATPSPNWKVFGSSQNDSSGRSREI